MMHSPLPNWQSKVGWMVGGPFQGVTSGPSGPPGLIHKLDDAGNVRGPAPLQRYLQSLRVRTPSGPLPCRVLHKPKLSMWFG